MNGTTAVGERVRRFRKDREMTVEDLARQSHTPVELIRDLEGGGSAPCLGSLIRITRALGIRPGTLLDDTVHDGPVVVRAAEREPAARYAGSEQPCPRDSLRFYTLGSGKQDRHMEPFVVDVRPGAESSTCSNHEGEEFLYVLSGRVRITYGGTTYRLEPGDSIYYDSVVPHELRAESDRTARILAVVFAPF